MKALASIKQDTADRDHCLADFFAEAPDYDAEDYASTTLLT